MIVRYKREKPGHSEVQQSKIYERKIWQWPVSKAQAFFFAQQKAPPHNTLHTTTTSHTTMTTTTKTKNQAAQASVAKEKAKATFL